MFGVRSCNRKVIREIVLLDKGWHLVIILEWSEKRKHTSHNFAKFRSPWLKLKLKSNSLDVSISIPYAINYLLDHNPCFQLDQKCSLIFCLNCLRLDYVVEGSRLIVLYWSLTRGLVWVMLYVGEQFITR